MSLFSSIGKAVKRLFKNPVVSTVASLATGGVGGLAIDAIASSGSPARIKSVLPATTTAPSVQTLPNIPKPGVSGALERILPGGDTGYLSRRKFKVGKLSGQPIPHGFHEKMSPQGTIYLVKTRRRRGITARDLQTYRRVHRTLKTYAKKYK